MKTKLYKIIQLIQYILYYSMLICKIKLKLWTVFKKIYIIEIVEQKMFK